GFARTGNIAGEPPKQQVGLFTWPRKGVLYHCLGCVRAEHYWFSLLLRTSNRVTELGPGILIGRVKARECGDEAAREHESSTSRAVVGGAVASARVWFR